LFNTDTPLEFFKIIFSYKFLKNVSEKYCYVHFLVEQEFPVEVLHGLGLLARVRKLPRLYRRLQGGGNCSSGSEGCGNSCSEGGCPLLLASGMGWEDSIVVIHVIVLIRVVSVLLHFDAWEAEG
jgi:hypothetical protein